MATVINNPAPTSDNSSYGMILGLVLLVVVLLVAVIYGRTLFSGGQPASETNPVEMNQVQEAPAEAPAGDQGGDTIINVPENMPDVNVPEQIDVNVNQDQPAQ